MAQRLEETEANQGSGQILERRWQCSAVGPESSSDAIFRDSCPDFKVQGFPCSSTGKESACLSGQETLVQFLGWEDSLEQG